MFDGIWYVGSQYGEEVGERVKKTDRETIREKEALPHT